MRHADEAQIVGGDAEHRVAPEVDARDIGAHRYVVERGAKAQAPVVRIKGEKMRLQRGLGTRQLADQCLHCPYFTMANPARAAASVSSISAVPCAAETNPAS